MNIYGNYKSPLGYQSGENYIDSYGVDHSGFSTRDEIEYQMARLAKENQIMQNFNKRGITKNYPQYGTNFWGNSDNNYGFGNSQISSNIENMQKSFSADNFDITGRTNLNNTQNINGNTLGNIVNNTLTETKGYHSPSNMMGLNNYYNPIEQALQLDIASVLSPKPLGNDANSYQLVQNTTPNTVSDVDILSIQNSTDKIFDRVFNKTLGEEGGYEDRPNKIDTATKNGIQQATLIRFKNKHPELAQGFPEHVKNLTQEQARLIALKDYYEPYRIGEIISPALQETMFDSFFNHSPNAPALWAQRAINKNTNMKVQEDGVFGSETINTMNKLSQDEIVKVNNAILKQRLEDHEWEKKTNPNPYYEKYTVGLPDRFKRFEIK